jgi:hypothetical protein
MSSSEIPPALPSEDPDATSPSDDTGVRGSLKRFVAVLRRGDDAALEQAVVQLSKVHRWLAPVGLLVGAVLMLFQGLKLLFGNWRLTLIQVLPAMWIWIAMLDLKVHALHGKSFHTLRGPILIPIILVIIAITAASFFLNAVFAFAVARSGGTDIRSAFADARTHLRVILSWGCGIGLALGFATMVTSRWGRGTFVLTLSIVVGIMMFCYLAVPTRLLGIKPIQQSRRDKLTTTAIGGALGAVVCSPPYLLGRIGILMLGSHIFFVPGIILLIIGLTLQAGTTSAVKSIKMSAKLVGGTSTPVPQEAETSP